VSARDTGAPPDVDDVRPEGDTVELTNEYASVNVRKVHTRNGVRLEIVSPKLGRGIRLCPVELESLTWQSHETFSGFLETPFGPEGEVDSDF
jgi:hypothetical protein